MCTEAGLKGTTHLRVAEGSEKRRPDTLRSLPVSSMNFHLWLLLAPVWVGLGAGWVLGVATWEATAPLGGGAAL